MTVRLPRVIRSGVFAALCVALAACAHVSMTTAELPSRWLALAFAGVMGCSWLLGGRPRAPLAVTGWMLALQGGLHQLFDRVQQLPGATGGKPDWISLLLCTAEPLNGRVDPEQLARAAGLDPDAMPAGTAMAHRMPGMPGMSGMVGTDGGAAQHGWALPDGLHAGSTGMVAAHALAALACALLFCRGDAAVSGLGRLLLALAHAVAPVLLLLPPTLRPVAPGSRPRRRERPAAEPVLLHVVVRRGPPRLALP
ncbi:hypothetical protein AB0K43_01960 [Kitasatospora sp. NPDC049258]|uniref:hypothetical protein n=1 Tax=Kitasatospora sp. NPDC049258 TaxID=3155394 RepID=UPI003447D934